MKLKVEFKNGHIIWDVNAKCRKIVSPVAAQFGMSVEEFLEKKCHRQLPGQTDSEVPTECGDLPGGFTVTPCDDDQIWRRVGRAARFSEKTTEAFIWGSLMAFVESCEDDMILSPVTGEPIGDDLSIERFRTGYEYRAEAA